MCALGLNTEPIAHDVLPFAAMSGGFLAVDVLRNQVRQLVSDGLVEHGLGMALQQIFVDLDASIGVMRASRIGFPADKLQAGTDHAFALELRFRQRPQGVKARRCGDAKIWR